MHRRSRLFIVMSMTSKNSTCVKSGQALLKGTLVVLSSIPFVLSKSDTFIPDVQGDGLA